MQDEASTDLSPGHREQHILRRRESRCQVTDYGHPSTCGASHPPPMEVIPGVSDTHLLPCTNEVASVRSLTPLFSIEVGSVQ